MLLKNLTSANDDVALTAQRGLTLIMQYVKLPKPVMQVGVDISVGLCGIFFLQVMSPPLSQPTFSQYRPESSRRGNSETPVLHGSYT